MCTEEKKIAHTFEVYVDAERLYLFGLDSAEAVQEWTKCLAKISKLTHGRLHYEGGLNWERAKGRLVKLWCSPPSTSYLDGSGREEADHLRKLQELSIQGDNEVLVLVERRRRCASKPRGSWTS
uniref:Uncharacterized protein n=1 Tax=Sphaerodactylus townsendi TaxID=933632 RepID=A0ACB8FG62_9SAUR